MESSVSINCTVNSYRKEVTTEMCSLEKISKNISTGMSVTSEPFFLEFPESLGHSMWVLVIYPKGQYISNGVPSGKIAVYVKMISAENENNTLKTNIKFTLSWTGSYQNHDSFLEKQSFCFKEKKQRWAGCKIASTSEVPRYASSDKLKISCRFNVDNYSMNRKAFIITVKRIYKS